MDYTIDAREAMDTYYGIGAWYYRSAPHVGSDLGAALNAAISARLPIYRRQSILIPPTGPWLMKTPIDPTLITGHHIYGDGGPFGTTIYYDSDLNCFDIGYTADDREGGEISNLIVNLEDGHPNAGCFLRLVAPDESGSPCGYIFDKLRASRFGATSSWLYSIAMSGMAKTNPQGIRGVVIRDSLFFCARLGGMWAAGIEQAIFDNVAFAVPATSVGADVLIGGGTTLQTRSNNVFLDGFVTVGKINLANITSIQGHLKSSGLTFDSTTVQHAGLFHDGPVSYSAPVSSGFVTQI